MSLPGGPHASRFFQLLRPVHRMTTVGTLPLKAVLTLHWWASSMRGGPGMVRGRAGAWLGAGAQGTNG